MHKRFKVVKEFGADKMAPGVNTFSRAGRADLDSQDSHGGRRETTLTSCPVNSAMVTITHMHTHMHFHMCVCMCVHARTHMHTHRE